MTGSARPRHFEPYSLPVDPGTGLPRMEPGRERYRVPGGGSIVLALAEDDEITITDLEGLQHCELTVFGPDGGEDLAALGLLADSKLSGLDTTAVRGHEDAQGMAASLSRYGINPEDAPALQLFGGRTCAGDSETFSARRKVLCLVAAPGAPMRVDEQNPPTDLRVLVKRAHPGETAEHPLPPPLAEMRLDLRVDKATAVAYEVKQGEYIQVIDVAGRQCSDFLAFDSRQLEQGLERGLDATATRTLMGAAYPRPGLYSKFFDTDMQPLLEVVRDTVGRHDTFALACTAKYYEDMGYLGHANCSDNFNAALDPYTITPRRGWPAMNLFYNTRIDADNVLYMDEAWSRPGDYVLLRALTDLVCLSSACPDDIDPANGWNPTDIHLRVYPAKKTFSRGIAYRMTPSDDPQLTRETAFHPRTSALTRDLTAYQGYWIPSSFPGQGTIQEYYGCREEAAIMDLSALRKFEVVGPDAESLMQYTVTRDVRRLGDGGIVYTAMCYDTGGMLDDGTLFRLGANNFRWICNSDYDGIWLREQARTLNLRAWVKSSTDQLHNVAVQGPRSRSILTEVVWTAPDRPSLEELTWFRFTVGRVGDRKGPPIIISRTGYTGELGYEVWCHPRDALPVWDAIWEAGQPHGLTPLGLEALDILRIESGLILQGQEFDDQTDPFEAGIGFTVGLSNDDDFIGKAALSERKAHPQRRLVGLELEGNEPGTHGDCIHVGRKQVGVITSATRSPVLKKNIALSRISVQYSEVGSQVEVGKLDGHQKRIPARVVPLPFYDLQKLHVRS